MILASRQTPVFDTFRSNVDVALRSSVIVAATKGGSLINSAFSSLIFRCYWLTLMTNVEHVAVLDICVVPTRVCSPYPHLRTDGLTLFKIV